MLKSSIGMLRLLCKDTNNIQKTYWEFNPNRSFDRNNRVIRESLMIICVRGCCMYQLEGYV